MFRASDIFGKRSGNNAGADALREKASMWSGLYLVVPFLGYPELRGAALIRRNPLKGP